VSTTQAELVAKFSAGVVDTGGKFAAGVVDTGGNLPPVLLTPVANLPPVSLTPVVHLDLRISPRIFEKIWNDPSFIFRGLGEAGKVIHEKNLKQKISCPFNTVCIDLSVYVNKRPVHLMNNPFKPTSRS
jgi:hypothetical protein